MNEEYDTNRPKASKIGKILLILFVISGIAGSIYSSFDISRRSVLEKELSQFCEEPSCEEVISYKDAGIKDEILSLAVASDKSNIVYAVSSGGDLLVSHNSGKSFEKTGSTGITCNPEIFPPQSRVISGENGKVYICVRHRTYSVIGMSGDYGNSWKFKKLDFPVYDIFCLDGSGVLYLSSRLRYNPDIKSYEYFKGYDFATEKFVRISNLNDLFLLSPRDRFIYPVHMDKNTILFSFDDRAGKFASETFSIKKNGNLELENFFNERKSLFKALMLSKIKDFCEISDGKFTVATDSGIYFLDLKNKKIEPLNEIVIFPNIILKNTENVFLMPLKLVFSKNYNTVFMLTKYGGIMAGRFIGKKFYWLAPFSDTVPTDNLLLFDSGYDVITPKRKYVLQFFPGYFFPSNSVVCYDFCLTSNYAMVATNSGLVKIPLEMQNAGH